MDNNNDKHSKTSQMFTNINQRAMGEMFTLETSFFTIETY